MPPLQEMPPSKKQKASASGSDPLAPMLEWFRAAGGTLHPGLHFTASNVHGDGGIATAELPAHADLIFVPRQCILSARAARESALGVALRVQAQ